MGKQERLKSRSLIESLFSGGERFNVPPFRVSYLITRKGEESTLQFGIGVGTRSFKRATDRNRIKRLVREAWRIQKPALLEAVKEQSAQLSVFLIYTGRDIPQFADVRDKVAVILARLHNLINAKGA